jgi:hypothetical protein
MRISYDIPDPEFEALAKAIFRKFPDASLGSPLTCTEADHEKMVYKFIDSAARVEKGYIVTERKILKALKKFIETKHLGKLAGVRVDDFRKASDYEGLAIDAVAQIACFGKVIYK